MAGASLLALLDDIATLLDDVAAMTKTAAAKTSGVLGDDLALNAEQVSGVRASRELPVVWAVAKGSMLNKAILVPAALAISGFAPWAVTPLLMAGGTYLCFEGIEKLFHSDTDSPATGEATQVIAESEDALREFERSRIRGAIRTDFILSAEIIVIALGTVATAGFAVQLGVLSLIAVLMTVGVYGVVACIVKLDDAGYWLQARESRLARGFGRFLLALAPRMMKGLSLAGMAAMFLVGGGILVHGLPWIAAPLEQAAATMGEFGWIATLAGSATVGIAAGLLALAAVRLFVKLRAALGAGSGNAA